MQIAVKKYSSVIVVWCFFLFMIHAQQEESAQKETDTDNRAVDITVTAAKRAKAVEMTAGEVGVVGLDEIEASQAQDLEDILRDQPGVEAPGPRSIGQRPNIRGLGAERVLVTIDGARLTFDSGHKGATFFEPDWIARAEVLRGPGSALYGSGALGGALNLRTIEPNDFLDENETGGIRLRLGYQNVNEDYKIAPTFFGRTDTVNIGEFEYLFTYTRRDSDDIELGNGDTLPFSSEESHSFLGKVIWRPTEANKLTFSSMRFDSDQEVPANTQTLTTAPRSLVDRETTQSLYSLNYKHHSPEYDWLNFEGTLYHTVMDLSEDRFDGDPIDNTEFTTNGIELRNSSFFELDDTYGLVLTYGYEYIDDEQEGKRNGGPNSSAFPDAESDQHAFFAQAELSFIDELITVIPGVRHDSWETESNTQKADDDHVSPKVGVVLKIDDELNLADGDYIIVQANYSEGFRAPNFGDLFISGTHFPGSIFVPNPDLKPETTENWELGTRVKVSDVRFRATYFETQAEDFIDSESNFFVSPITFTPMNVEKAEIDGIELSADWQATEQLSFMANYTRTRGDNETDNVPLDSIAPDRITLGTDYELQDLGLSFAVRVRIVDDQNRVHDDGPPPSDSYTVVDLTASWQPPESDWGWLSDFRFDFGIDNVGDEDYQPFLSGVPEAGINPKLTVTYTKTW